ncbi:MAG: hypothetical protein E7214_05125 [Clostridium sp.]|nr:hypothetical protein [Clostridium sp.]
MNKKKLTVTLTLVVLMLLLVFIQGFFDDRFKDIAIMNKNMGHFKEYYLDNGKYIFSLPNKWKIKKSDNDKSGISKAEFKDKENNIIGYIEVGNTNKKMNELAQLDIDNMVLEHSNEVIENYKSNNRKGIRTNYKTKVKKGYTFVNENYYIPLDNAYGKITFIIKEENYSDDINIILKSVVNSLKS